MAVEFKTNHKRGTIYDFDPADIVIKPELNGRHETQDDRGEAMIARLKILRPRDNEFVVSVLSHVVGQGNYSPDMQDPCRWFIEPSSNNWWARIEDGALTITGRYADDATMQAVKQMLLFRCESDVKEL